MLHTVEGKSALARAVRWIWVLVLLPMTLLCLALAPASGLLTLPFGLTTGGLTIWMLQEALGRPRSRLATVLTVVGLAFIVATLLTLVVLSRVAR